MKIYWKNLIWNYTGRYWWKLKCFCKNLPYKNFWCCKRVWNSKQKAELEKKLKEEMLKIEWLIRTDPLIHIPIKKKGKKPGIDCDKPGGWTEHFYTEHKWEDDK